MKKINFLLAAIVLVAGTAFAQVEGPAKTQALIQVDTKGEQIPALADVRLRLNGKEEPLTGWSQVPPSGVQVAVLIDDGLPQSVGTEIDALKAFTTNLPEGAQIFIGYMRNGSITTVQRFTTEHASAAQKYRIPSGPPGISGSPYLCLSDFVKHWPTDSSRPGARFVLMLTNGVDPYNGSTGIFNQDSPYVAAAVTDAQRAGVSVSSIYYGDAGFRGDRGSFSGQSYLTQVADGTGGRAYVEGLGSPVSLAPYLSQFRKQVSETYLASFVATEGHNKLVRLQAETSLHNVKLRAPAYVEPGNLESSPTQ